MAESFRSILVEKSVNSLRYIVWNKNATLPLPMSVISDISFTYARLPFHYFSRSVYIIKMQSVYSKLRRRIPNRVITLDLSESYVYCINNNWYVLNKTNVPTILPKTVLFLDLSWTYVQRIPIGFFISLQGSCHNYAIQPKNRESIIRNVGWSRTMINFRYVCKSIRIFTCFQYPRNSAFRRSCILYTGVYNTRYKVIKTYDGDDHDHIVPRYVPI